MGKQGYNGKSSKKFTGGSNRHHGGTLSNSGGQNYGSAPRPRRGNGGSGQSFGTSIANALFGPGPSSTSHGGKKKRSKKKSR